MQPRRTAARPPQQRIDHYLRNAAGSVEMNVNGETTEVPFFFIVPGAPGAHGELVRLNVLLLASTVAPADFGSESELTNGLEITTRDVNGLETFDFMDGLGLIKNADWTSLAGVDSAPTAAAGGANPDLLAVRWTLMRGGASVELKAGESFRVTVRDDISGIVQLRCKLQGQLHSHQS